MYVQLVKTQLVYKYIKIETRLRGKNRNQVEIEG